MFRHVKHGFTLIELLVVISIIGMLASVVLVALQGAKQKGVFASAETFSHTLESGLYNDGLVFLNFDSMAGMTANDIISNNSGTLPITAVGINGATLVADTGLYNRGYQLGIPTSGSNPIILTVPNINNYISTDNFTFAVWYKPMPGSYQLNWTSPLIGWDTNSGGARLGVNYADGNGNVNGIYFGFPVVGGVVGTTANVSLPSGKWAYIAMSVKNQNGNVLATLYVNGNVVSSYSSAYSAYSPSNGYRVEVGGFCCSAITTGIMDDLAIYDVSATAADIKDIYAEGAAEHGLALAN